MSTPTIGELTGVCEEMAAVSRRLFEIVGTWVADETDPAVQRWFSTGAHRHAWHAELWEARRPAVPIGFAVPDQVLVGPDDASADDRVGWYRSRLRGLLGELDRLSERIDAEIDPSTARTVALVRADLVDLLDGAVHAG